MGEPMYLMDTKAIIDYLSEKLPVTGMEFLNGIVDVIQPNVSVITKIELLGFNALEERYQLLVNFINDASVFDLTSHVATQSIDIRKNINTKLPDAIIAATAVAYGFKLVTRNIADFKNISGLELINPWNMQKNERYGMEYVIQNYDEPCLQIAVSI